MNNITKLWAEDYALNFLNGTGAANFLTRALLPFILLAGLRFSNI